jgi:hypothetical protein
MQLIFVAAGSRRLLHDIVSGAYVVAPGEDLKTYILSRCTSLDGSTSHR